MLANIHTDVLILFKGEDNLAISGHSIPLVSLGAFILIVGFFAFNDVSQVLVLMANLCC